MTKPAGKPDPLTMALARFLFCVGRRQHRWIDAAAAKQGEGEVCGDCGARKGGKTLAHIISEARK